jgi:ribosomal small subunit protein bTHX
MGRGDKRSFKGKVFKGSYGKTRPRHEQKKDVSATAGSTPGAAQKKKAAA